MDDWCRTVRTMVVVGLTSWTLAAAETVIPIPNGGLEDGWSGWKRPDSGGLAALSTEQAAGGTCSLKIVDDHPKHGSDVTAAAVPVTGAGAFELRGKLFAVSGGGLGMYVRVRDANGKVLSGDSHLRGLSGSDKTWRPFAVPFYTTSKAASLELWIHSYSHAKVVAYLDDLHFVDVGTDRLKPPWEGQYKIRPDETERLTEADVVGPDGIVYPDWSRCGVQGGIPDVPVAARIEDFGGEADDDADDSAALDRGCVAVGERGGGVLLLGEGTYMMDRPVTVRHNGVVIRGQGASETRLVFRYGLPDSGVAFYHPPAGSRIGPGTPIEVHCSPTGLARMTLYAGETEIRRWQRSTHSGNSFALSRKGRDLMAKGVPNGLCTLRCVAEYRDGSRKSGEVRVTVDSAFKDTVVVASSRAAILFQGRGYAGPRIKLVRNGERGDTALHLENTNGLSAGDGVLIDGPATKRWKELTRNVCKWGTYRRNALRITSVAGGTVTVAQPLRIEFPVVDGAYVQKIVPIERCGIEDLAIEQTEDLWISTVLFSQAWNCWGQGVTVRKCGRFPIYGSMAKWCEIRDCVFDDAWFKGGGGTAYAGWENSWDCLMEGVETFKLRHGPLFQWAAAGCVIRRSVFHDSDAQWHSGWTQENLMEQCVVESRRGHGSYGYGMWASPPEDTAHGPNGPRNVVYNCDVSSERTGLWMGGMNENWLILHNRFVVENGQGVFAKTASFDHIIKGNVFVLKNPKHAMVFLATPDCIGVELSGNALYGGDGIVSAGVGEAGVERDNRTLPLGEDLPARPRPDIPSIYEWQVRNVRRP